MISSRKKRFGVAVAAITAVIAVILQPNRANADTAPPTACDAAASFAFDPQRVAPGVSYTAINTPVAIAQCAQAVRLYPTSGRLQFELGRALEKAGKLPQAIAAYQRAAEFGHGGGFNNLGELYRSGKGVPRNLTFALREFEQGAARSYPEAQYNLANLLLSQARTDANIERARQLLTSALNAGYTDAAQSLQSLPPPQNAVPSTASTVQPALGAVRATGPSFDCSKIGRDALSTIICSSPELSAQNLLLGQTYYALRHQVGAFGHDALKADAKASNTAMKQHCAVPSTTPLPLPAQSYVACVRSETDSIRGSWMSRLTNEDLEEAKRPIEQLIAAQQELIRQGLLSYATNADGIFGDSTRKALSSWQAANGLPALGTLDDKTAALLLKLSNAPSAPPATAEPTQPAIASAATPQAAPSPADGTLAKVFVPKMLDIQVPYLETIVGPAMRLTKLQHDLELRTYQVGDCELLAYSKGSTVSAYGLRVKAGCAADLSQFLGQPLSVTADATFGGLGDALGGATGTFQSACIYDCGNATGSRVEWTWQGSHAQNFTKVELAVALVEPDSASAAAAWQNAMLSRESQQYVASAHFNCDGKYQQEASSAFRSVKITELFVGHGESMDDQDVAMACPPSGGASNVAPVSATAPPVSNVTNADTPAPPQAPIATAATVTTPPPIISSPAQPKVPLSPVAATQPAPDAPTAIPETGGTMTFLMMWFWRLVGAALVIGVLLGVAMVLTGAGLIPTDAPTKDGSNQFTRKDGYVIGLPFTIICLLLCWGAFSAASSDSALLSERAQNDKMQVEKDLQTDSKRLDAQTAQLTEEEADNAKKLPPQDEQEIIDSLKNFDLSPYTKQISELGDMDRDGKQRIVDECSSHANEVIKNPDTLKNWLGTVSLYKCDLLTTPTNQVATCDDPDSVQVSITYAYDDHYFHEISISTEYISKENPVYAQVLKLHNKTTVRFSGNGFTPKIECGMDYNLVGYMGKINLQEIHEQ